MNSNNTPINKIFVAENPEEANQITVQRRRQQDKHDDFESRAKTQKMLKKVVLYDQKLNKHKFIVHKDKQIGVPKVFQNVVMQSWNDDDKRTSTTQMQRGMAKTLEDLYDELEERNCNDYRENSFGDPYYATQ